MLVHEKQRNVALSTCFMRVVRGRIAAKGKQSSALWGRWLGNRQSLNLQRPSIISLDSMLLSCVFQHASAKTTNSYSVEWIGLAPS